METLNTYEFRRGSGNKYPYDEWLDGKIHRLKRSEDFAGKVKIQSIRSQISKKATEAGKNLLTQIESPDVIVIQAKTPSPVAASATPKRKPAAKKRAAKAKPKPAPAPEQPGSINTDALAA